MEKEQAKIDRENEIKMVIELCLNYTCRKTWTQIIFLRRVMEGIQEKFDQKMAINTRESLKKFNVTKIQRYYKKRILWRLVLNPYAMTNAIIKSSLTLYASMIEKKVCQSNIYKIA